MWPQQHRLSRSLTARAKRRASKRRLVVNSDMRSVKNANPLGEFKPDLRRGDLNQVMNGEIRKSGIEPLKMAAYSKIAWPLCRAAKRRKRRKN